MLRQGPLLTHHPPCACCFPLLSLLLLHQLLGCRGSLADREAGHIFATPARICQVPVHSDD